MDRAATEQATLQQIGQEWEVLDADGAKVGVVNEVHANYVWVQQGLLFPKDAYIPVTAITKAGDGRVQLNVTSEEIGRAGWDTLPQTLGNV